MPLDNRAINSGIREMLRNIPFDNSEVSELPYQTKVNIYDEKCSGCGFARVEAIIAGKMKVFHKVDPAIDLISKNGGMIRRMCEYPSDIEYKNGHPLYQDVNTIVTNTCRFWNAEETEPGNNAISWETYNEYKEGLLQ